MTNINKYFIANLKMYGNKKYVKSIKKVIDFKKKKKYAKVKIIYCPPYTLLSDFVNYTKSSSIDVGAQNCHQDEFSGSYTGSISSNMIKSIGAKYVKTDYVHFVDGDMEINIDWANKALTKLQSNNRIAAVHGFKKVYTKNYKDYFILSDTEDWEADYLQGAFLINREIYNRVGGLDSRLYGEEERDLYIRIKSIGYEVWYLHQLMGSHYDLKLKTMKRSFFSNLQAMIWIPFIKSVKNNIIGSYIFVYRLALVSLLLDFISIFFVMIGTVTGIVIAILFQFIELLYSIMINRKGYFIIWKVALLNIFRVYKIWNQETTYSIERIK